MSELIQKIQNNQYEDFTKQELIQAIKDLRVRISLISDFTQCEMDEKNVCKICNYPFHPDYCYERDNDSGDICDVCCEN